MADIVPSLCAEGVDLFTLLLEYDPAKRISAKRGERPYYFCSIECTVVIRAKIVLGDRILIMSVDNFLHDMLALLHPYFAELRDREIALMKPKLEHEGY